MVIKVLSESNNSCQVNITIEEIKTTALALGIPALVCLLFSIVGLVVELIFICRNKSNFLLRLFVYLSVAVSISLGTFSLHLYSYWDQNNKTFCAVTHAILHYSITAEQLLIFSINIVLLYKVCSSVFRACMCRWTQKLNKFNRLLEVLFIVIHFGIPLIVASIILGYQNPEDVNYWTLCYEQNENHSLTECNDQKSRVFLEKAITTMIPVFINLLLSIACIAVLLLWLLWLQSRHFLRARMRTINKEIGLWLGYLILYCFFWILVSTLDDLHVVTYPLFPISHIAIPISFFVYTCVRIRHRHKKKRSAHEENHNVHVDPHTPGLETSPLSTRISLPSDTADHAPNFLSPEELSEVTLLIN